MMVDDQAKTRLSESAPDPLVGREFDGYRIDEILGRGGMGVVYKATQQSLGRAVAIKVLPEDVTENRQFLDRFRREVDILARLSHPNIVTVFERGEIDGRPYIAMELVRGSTLREVMRKGPLPPGEALLVVRSVLGALEHAHAEGIVHRDIKPENVLVAPGGIVKVADFGLSRHLEGDGRTRLTQTYVALGTYEYMSPEQREMARDADARSDLYATGVVLYEMIAGELPIGAFEPLSRKRPKECDARLDELVERSLRKAPESRWKDATEMGDAVSRLLSQVPAEAPPEPVAVPAPAAADHGPKWKRVLSNIFGKEYPVARVEGKLPKKFAEKVLEDIEVQRYLGRLVTLWPHFPGGMEVSKQNDRLVLELEGMRGDDPVRDKRVAAAVGAVLEANAGGKLRRIAVADPEWEDANKDALASPPVADLFAPVRPSDIAVHSRVVSGVERRHPGMAGPLKALFWALFGLAAAAVGMLVIPYREGGAAIAPVFILFGIGAAVAALWFVVRGSRPPDGSKPEFNYGLSVLVTALWVGIVIANAGSMRDEEIAWLCVGAIASVFLLPRLPLLLENAGRALLVLLAIVFGIGILASTVYLFVGIDEPAAVARAESSTPLVMTTTERPTGSRPDPLAPFQDWDEVLARSDADLPTALPDALRESAKARAWLVDRIDGADVFYREGFGLSLGDGRALTLHMPRGTQLALHRAFIARGMSPNAAQQAVGRAAADFGAALANAAHSFVPMRLKRVRSGGAALEKELSVIPKLADPLLLPDVAPFEVEAGELAKEWNAHLVDIHEDVEAWQWIRKVSGDWPELPDPEQVEVLARDGKLVVRFDETWRRRTLAEVWRHHRGDERAAREFMREWLEGLAAYVTVTLEARFKGFVKRTKFAEEKYERAIRDHPFEAR